MDVANLLLRVTGNNQDAKQSLNEVATRLAALAATDAEATIGLNGGAQAKAELDSLEESLTIIGSRDVTARVRVKIDKDKDALGNLRRELDHALGGGAGARPIRAILDDIQSLGQSIVQTGGLATNFFERLGASASEAAMSGVGSLVKMLPMLLVQIALLVAAGGLLFGVISALLAVVGALVASLALALAGVGALAVAFGGLLIPALAVLIGLITRVVGAYKAVSDAQKKSADNTKALTAANDAHTQAVKQAAAAEENVNRQRLAAYDAQRDAALGVKNAEDALAEARLGITDANIRLERAKLNLKEVKAEAKDAGPAFERLFNQFQDVASMSPSDLAAADRRVSKLPGNTDAQLDVKEALQEVAHARLGVVESKHREEGATNDLTDAIERNNEFLRQGIRAYEPYQAAIENSATANKAVAKTQEDIGDLRRKQNAELKKYSKDEIATAKAIVGLFSQIKKMFQTAAAPALHAMRDLLIAIGDLIGDDRIAGGVNDIGEAFAYVFRQWAKFLKSDRVVDMFADLLRISARLVRVLGGDVFTDLANILLIIADEAAPTLIRFFRRFSEWLHDLGSGEEGTERVRNGVQRVLRSLGRWVEVGKQLAKLFLNFLKAAGGQGDNLADSIAGVLRKLNKLLDDEKGRAKFRKWLKDNIQFAKDLGQAFIDFVGILGDVWDAMKKIKHTMDDIAKLKLPNKVAGIDDRGMPSQKQGSVGVANWILGLFGKSAKGGVFSEASARIIGEEPGVSEAVIPLKDSVLAGIGRGIVGALHGPSGAGSGRSALASLGAGGTTTNYYDITLPPPPAADVPDARASAVMLARELARRGGGSLV